MNSPLPVIPLTTLILAAGIACTHPPGRPPTSVQDTGSVRSHERAVRVSEEELLPYGFISKLAYEAAMAACTRCNGEWGPQGVVGRLGCNCRMTDVGRECRDGNECEGSCLYQ